MLIIEFLILSRTKFSVLLSTTFFSGNKGHIVFLLDIVLYPTSFGRYTKQRSHITMYIFDPQNDVGHIHTANTHESMTHVAMVGVNRIYKE